jgi:rare lipoprotein A
VRVPIGSSVFALLLGVSILLSCSSAKAEKGYASYYRGRGHRGAMTCAHRTRPFGTIIKVTYHGRSVRCVVNDRGPFIRGRIIDLSISAARALGMMGAGIAFVSLE